MHVCVRRARHLVVHDVVHRGDVEPARGDVRREQDRVGRRLEPVEVLQALPLLELRMQREGGDGEQLEQRLQPPDAVNGGEEDERAAGVAEEEVVEVRVLVGREAVDAALFERRDDAVHGRDVDHRGTRVAEVEAEEQVVER